MTVRIALTGATGRFGTALRAEAPDVVPVPRVSLADPLPGLRDARPDVVVHAAAMTDVDACERDPAAAHEANVASTQRLAAACAQVGARLVYLSTDYVFDGERGGYKETDAPNPVSVYGRTKLEGERAALAAPGALVCRTSVVFGTPGRPDFVSWLAGKLRAREPFDLVAEQRASPTSTPDLARQVLALAGAGVTGIVHTAGADALSRADMARTVASLLGAEPTWRPVPFDKAPWVARRPRDSSLDVAKASRHARPMPFRDAARAYLEALP